MTRLTGGSRLACWLRLSLIVAAGGLASMAGGRICPSVVAAGPEPALGEVVTASSRHSGRGHDESILMAVIGPVGR